MPVFERLLERVAVPVDAVALKIEPAGRRRHERAELRLSGRYMLENRCEYGCRTTDLAPGGLAIQCDQRGRIGERIVAYVNELGRLEGDIVRLLKDGFAFKIQASPRKVAKLASQIAWLVDREALGLPDNRLHERIATDEGHTILATEGGQEFLATLIDLSSRGAALNVEASPPIGSAVTVGRARGRVVRHFFGGIAVTFSELLRIDGGSVDQAADALALAFGRGAAL